MQPNRFRHAFSFSGILSASSAEQKSNGFSPSVDPNSEDVGASARADIPIVQTDSVSPTKTGP